MDIKCKLIELMHPHCINLQHVNDFKSLMILVYGELVYLSIKMDSS